MHKRRYPNPAPLFVLTGMALFCAAAWAQQPGQALPVLPSNQAGTYSTAGAGASRDGASQEEGIALQLMDVLVLVHPSVKLDMGRDDNIFRAPNNQASDSMLVLTPALHLTARQGGNTYELHLSSVMGRYQNYTAENYTNNKINGAADFNLGTRLRTLLEADYTDGVDARGSTNNAVSPAPDHYRQAHGRGVLSFGAPSAQGRVDLELGRLRREYLNNRETTAASDRTVDDIGATFNWRVGPKTTLLFQGKHSNIDYDLDSSTLGSTESAFLVGGTWEASAKTSGTFRIGPAKKTFDDSTRGSYTSTAWLGAMRWSPRTYSHVDLSLSRAPSETSGGVGDYIDKTSTIARWNHAWSTTLTTEASAAYLADDYRGIARNDNTQEIGLRASYRMRRWLSFGAEYARSVRDSDDSNFDYKRNLLMFFVEAAL